MWIKWLNIKYEHWLKAQHTEFKCLRVYFCRFLVFFVIEFVCACAHCFLLNKLPAEICVVTNFRLLFLSSFLIIEKKKTDAKISVRKHFTYSYLVYWSFSSGFLSAGKECFQFESQITWAGSGLCGWILLCTCAHVFCLFCLIFFNEVM